MRGEDLGRLEKRAASPVAEAAITAQATIFEFGRKRLILLAGLSLLVTLIIAYVAP